MKKFSSFLIVLLLMLASFTAGMEYPRGDVSQDGQVDISDVTVLIDYLLNGTWPDEPETPQTETFTVNGISFTMVEVEGGTFTMGASDNDSVINDNERPAHQVTLSSFSIGQTEVTQELWQAVMGSNPSDFTSANGYTDDMSRPVNKVSWDDCQTFITRLNELTGKQFRLPTEAEWEFAARGGNQSQGYIYAGSNDVDNVAWHCFNIPSQTSGTDGYGTQPVATKAPNELGLYDMSGNVFEWCQDWYGDYSSEAQTNPTGPATGSYHVERGGSWNFNFQYGRVSDRELDYPSSAGNWVGLRLAMSDESEQEEQHEYVDLGLPSGTLWATCNVGATAPEEYGDYFAWGETEPKEEYTWENYQWCNGSDTTLTKYCIHSDYGYNGFVDGKIELDPEDDAAYVNWGPSWRMPSKSDIDELIENCTWEWTQLNGMNGRLFTGPNGNTLFLPAAGCHHDSIAVEGELGDYWTRTLGSHSNYAFGICFSPDGKQWWNITRNTGFTVRAVRVPQN